MLARLNSVTVVKTLISNAPRNKNEPRSAKIAAALNDTKTTLVATEALTTTCGFTAITCDNNGPRECPDKKPNPSKAPSRM